MSRSLTVLRRPMSRRLSGPYWNDLMDASIDRGVERTFSQAIAS